MKLRKPLNLRHPQWPAEPGLRPLSSAILQNSLLLSWGVGAPTFTRADGADGRATFVDFEGRIVPVRAGEARFQGARRVRNYVPADLSSGSYSKLSGGSGSIPVVTSGFTDPEGGSTAYRVQLSRGATGDANYSILRSGTTVGNPMRSVWLKSNTGASQVIGLAGAGVSTSFVTVTTAWQRFAPATVDVSSVSSFDLANYGALCTTLSADILAWHPQLESVTGQSNIAPSEDIDSATDYGTGTTGVKYFDYLNGNTVSSNVVIEATGARIVAGASGVAATAPVDSKGPFGYLSEGSRQNICLQSQNFDLATGGAPWNNTTLLTSTLDAAVAPDGTTTADKLVEAAGTNQHQCRQAITTTAAAHTFSVYLKAGERTFAWLYELSSAAGVHFNLSTGAVGNVVGNTPTSSSITSVGNGWYRCSITVTTTAASNTFFVGLSADGVTANISYAGDTSKGLYVWGAQVEAASFASTYIPTTSAAVTRAADSLTYTAAGNISGTVGTCCAETTYEGFVAAGTNMPVIGAAADNRQLLNVMNSTMLQQYDGTNINQNTITALTTNTITKLAATWGGSAMQGFVNGTALASKSFDGDFNFGTNIALGTWGGVNQQFMTIRNVRIYGQVLNASQIAAAQA